MSRATKTVEAYIPLFIGPYLSDTMHLTRDQHGGYFLLLLAYWRNGGPLPDDDILLSGIVKASPAEWRKLRPVLVRFFSVEGGLWVQKRADAEIARAIEIRAKRVAAGGKGANTRWQADSKPIASAMAKPSQKDGIEPLTLSSNEDRSAKADVDMAVEAYNSIAKPLGWTSCDKLTPKRRAGLKARMGEGGGLIGWKAAMQRAGRSPFLRGETGRGSGHESWRPSIDFFLRPDSFAKLTEGGYDGPTGATRPNAGPAADPRAPDSDAKSIRRLQCFDAGEWHDLAWGPPPGSPGCLIPDRILAEWSQRKAA